MSRKWFPFYIAILPLYVGSIGLDLSYRVLIESLSPFMVNQPQQEEMIG